MSPFPTRFVTPSLLVLLPLAAACSPGPAAAQSASADVLEEHAVFAFGGFERRVKLLHPDGAEAPPLLLVLHGVGGDEKRLRAFTDGCFDRLAAEAGVLVVYPEAHAGVWNDCRLTGDSAARAAGVDDVAFLEAVVEFAREGAGGALGGVFVAGYSNGGQMALRLALEAPELVDGVALFGSLLPVEGDRGCPTDGAPVPTLLVAGTADPVSPFEGGLVEPPEGPARGAVLSARASAEWLARRAGHAGEPSVRRLADEDRGDACRIVERSWSAEGLPEITLLEVHGGGHTLPLREASFPALLGPTCHDVDGAAAIWDFCARQGKGD